MIDTIAFKNMGKLTSGIFICPMVEFPAVYACLAVLEGLLLKVKLQLVTEDYPPVSLSCSLGRVGMKRTPVRKMSCSTAKWARPTDQLLCTRCRQALEP